MKNDVALNDTIIARILFFYRLETVVRFNSYYILVVID